MREGGVCMLGGGGDEGFGNARDGVGMNGLGVVEGGEARQRVGSEGAGPL